MKNAVKLQPLSHLHDIPTCVDCKWYKIYNKPLPDLHVCEHPSTSTIVFDPVIGNVRHIGESANEARDVTGRCGPEGKHFEEKHWANRYFSVIMLAAIVLVVLFWVSWSKADEPLPDSWAAQIELTEDPVFVPGAPMTEFEAEFGARMQPREGELEKGGELDPTGKPVDMRIDNLGGNGDE